jgi:hypothetical protein
VKRKKKKKVKFICSIPETNEKIPTTDNMVVEPLRRIFLSNDRL